MNHQAVADIPPQEPPLTRAGLLKDAVWRNRAASRKGLQERLFTALFDNLVYPQIWEDPEIDLAALDIRPGHHVVAIASGGCNVLSYLVADPGRVTAVDLNPAHIALNRLKLAGLRHLPCHDDFHRFFAEAGSLANEHHYDLFLTPHLDAGTRAYWSGRGGGRKRRIEVFCRNFYRHGLLGRFITVAHLLARAYGVDPADIMQARGIEEQRRFFDRHLAPLFDKKLIRWLTSSPASLYGLGIPPAQYDELAQGRHMADVLRERLGRLACGHALKDNYFARQAFARGYGPPKAGGALPPYLQAENWSRIRARAGRVEVLNRSITDVLAEAPPASVDRIALLDAQDWMSANQLAALWSAITHAAAPQARIIFRTAARKSPLEAQLSPEILAPWRYERALSAQLGAADRSAIYGGFHLYVHQPDAS